MYSPNKSEWSNSIHYYSKNSFLLNQYFQFPIGPLAFIETTLRTVFYSKFPVINCWSFRTVTKKRWLAWNVPTKLIIIVFNTADSIKIHFSSHKSKFERHDYVISLAWSIIRRNRGAYFNSLLKYFSWFDFLKMQKIHF